MAKKALGLTAKGRHTRQRIVEAADRLIGRHGVTRVTLEDVRAEAKVSSSQIYHYFVDKQSLLSAVVDHQETLSVDQPSMQGDFDSPQAVEAWVRRLIEQQQETRNGGGCPITALSTGTMGIDADTVTQIARMFRRYEDKIRAGYRAMHANGGMAPDADPDALATMTLATAIGGLVLTQLNHDTRSLQAALDGVLGCLRPRYRTGSNTLVP